MLAQYESAAWWIFFRSQSLASSTCICCIEAMEMLFSLGKTARHNSRDEISKKWEEFRSTKENLKVLTNKKLPVNLTHLRTDSKVESNMLRLGVSHCITHLLFFVFFHQIVDPAARLILSHLKFAKDFASRALRLSKTAGSTPRLNCPTPTQTLLLETWKIIPT